MAAKPLTTEAIALTEKKMDMTLDDIIKMSKTNGSKAKKQRVSNRNQQFANNARQDKFAKVQRFMDTRSSMRQGALALRRTKFHKNQFPLANEAAKRAAVAPIRNKSFNRNRVVIADKKRMGTPQVQRKAVDGHDLSWQESKQQVTVPKQRPQTLDSLFANMKEQRMKVLSNQTNAARKIGGGQRRPPWARGNFGH